MAKLRALHSCDTRQLGSQHGHPPLSPSPDAWLVRCEPRHAFLPAPILSVVRASLLLPELVSSPADMLPLSPCMQAGSRKPNPRLTELVRAQPPPRTRRRCGSASNHWKQGAAFSRRAWHDAAWRGILNCLPADRSIWRVLNGLGSQLACCGSPAVSLPCARRPPGTCRSADGRGARGECREEHGS